jgi:hypothetical protein
VDTCPFEVSGLCTEFREKHFEKQISDHYRTMLCPKQFLWLDEGKEVCLTKLKKAVGSVLYILYLQIENPNTSISIKYQLYFFIHIRPFQGLNDRCLYSDIGKNFLLGKRLTLASELE